MSLVKSYRAEYAGRLVVQLRENCVEFTVFEGEAIIWQASASDVDAGKNAALFEAREWSGDQHGALPNWVPCGDEPNL